MQIAIYVTDFNSLFMPTGTAKPEIVCPIRQTQRIIYSTPAIKMCDYLSVVEFDYKKTHGKRALNQKKCAFA